MIPRKPRRSLAALMALTLPAAGLADGAVWRVSNDTSTVFLGGTMHKLSPQQYPLPPEYQAAYEQSDVVVFETDIAAMRSPEVQARIAARSRLADGETLATVLDSSVYEDLEAYCEETGFPIGRLESLKAVPAMLTLLAITLNSLGVTAPGVDEHFFQRARADAKDTRALETTDEQIEYLMSLDQGDPDQFVTQSLEDLREARRGGLEEGLRIWREGTENALVEHFLRDQMLYSPGMYQTLLVDRNLAWMHAIRRYIETDETELVLVGVAHLVGDDGLPALLSGEGFTVEKFSTH